MQSWAFLMYSEPLNFPYKNLKKYIFNMENEKLYSKID